MSKWRDIKMESPRERLKKRRQMEIDKKKRLEQEKKIAFRNRIIMFFGIVLAVIIAFAGFVIMRSKRAVRAEIARTRTVDIIVLSGTAEYRSAEDDVFLEDSSKEYLEVGEGVRLDDRDSIRLDFGSDMLISVRGPAELQLIDIHSDTPGRADVELDFSGNRLAVRKPTGRGTVKITHELAEVICDVSTLSVFKVEGSDSGTFRIAVKSGEVKARIRDEYSDTLIPSNKAMTVDNSQGYIDKGEIKSINSLVESWE